ncbi:MAG: tetratricopeptide repeat-containing sensor histidine kinase [Candidatus Cloacimonetes bacterium]|nr:tetratricopeptide repeat-containing sensor histidine kinase [Candidatus Cloacimonadota bacterium]
MKSRIILLIIFAFTFIKGQPNPDSLLRSIESLDDTNQVKKLTELCWNYRSRNPRLAIRYGLMAINKMENIDDKKFNSETYNFLGVIYGNLGKLDSAFYYYNLAIDVAEKIKDSTQIAYSLNNIGDYYFKNALFSIALEKIYDAYEMFEKLGDERGRAYALNDIGEIYLKQKNYEKALDHFLRSGEIRLRRNDYRGYAKSLINEAHTYEMTGLADKALEVYHKALEYSRKAGYIKGESWVIAGISDIYAQQGKYEEALEKRFESLKIDLKIGNKYGEIINYNQIGAIYLSQGLLSQAEAYLKKAMIESKTTGHRDQLMISNNLLRKLYLDSGNYRDAYKYLESYEAIEDSIFSQENSNKIADLQSAFITERKDRENELLKKEIEFEQETRNYFILITLLVSGVVILFISLFRSERKANKKLNEVNQQLNELNAQKDKMLSIIGHDLKNPVGAIRSFLEALHNDYNEMEEEERKQFIHYSYESSEKLTKLLLELLEWGRLTRGIVDIQISNFDLKEVIEELTVLMAPSAKQKNIKIEYFDCDKQIKTDRNMINTVLRNFVNNSIKFTPHGGTISISSNEDENYNYICVKDTGVGIEQNKIEDLFRIDRVTTTLGTSQEAGTGLGLPIANEFVQKCGGEILVESILGEGSKFILKLPKKI